MRIPIVREPLSSPRKAAEWIERCMIRSSNREHIIMACCDANGRTVCIDDVGRGMVGYYLGIIQGIFKAEE